MMHIMKRVSWIVGICFVMSMALPSVVTMANAGGPWKGRIVDMETGEPLEGAVVLAVWDTVYRTPTGPHSNFYNARETLSDKDGYFEVPRYTPINFLPLIRSIKGPFLHIFKPEYLKVEIYNWEGMNEKPVELTRWVGDTTYTFRLSPGLIELPRLKTNQERKINLGRPLIPKNMMPNYMKLENQERINLGFQPYRLKGDAK